MKNLIIIVCLIISSTSFAQKKSKTIVTTPTPITSVTDGNVTFEIITTSGKQKLVFTLNNAGKKETVLINEFTTKDKTQNPTDLKIKSFTVNNVKLYHIYYKETIKTETKTKKENAVKTNNEIWDLTAATKMKLIGNIQTITNIKEIVKLGNSTATETVEKTRKEGFEFLLSKDFEVFLSNKTQTNKYKFNATTRRYDPKK